MVRKYTLLGRIFCKWLNLHWLWGQKRWVYGGQVHGVCRICGQVVSRPAEKWDW